MHVSNLTGWHNRPLNRSTTFSPFYWSSLGLLVSYDLSLDETIWRNCVAQVEYSRKLSPSHAHQGSLPHTITTSTDFSTILHPWRKILWEYDTVQKVSASILKLLALMFPTASLSVTPKVSTRKAIFLITRACQLFSSKKTAQAYVLCFHEL